MAKTAAPRLRLRDTQHPVLYEVNACVLLQECSAAAGKVITLGDLPETLLDEWAALGFDVIWLMGVWTRSEISRDIARVLPDLQGEYRVAAEFGGSAALRRLRTRLARKGMGLVLDFVCNHTARDCQWVRGHPEWYINGAAGDDRGRPDMFFVAETARGEQVIAHGRDPMFSGWTDTAQLNHRSRDARGAIIKELERISALCDGVRCDMAMLLLNDVFDRTWHDHLHVASDDIAPGEFWKEAIDHVHALHPDFLFLAESYWNREWDLQQLGFQYTYDKTLYDRLLREGASSVHDHLRAELAYQKRSIRFVENHDEPRAARVLPSEAAWAAAGRTAQSAERFVLQEIVVCNQQPGDTARGVAIAGMPGSVARQLLVE
jgi:glycosidase